MPSLADKHDAIVAPKPVKEEKKTKSKKKK